MTKTPYHLHFILASGDTIEWSGSNTSSSSYFYYPTLEKAMEEVEQAYANHDAGKGTNFKAPRGRLAVLFVDYQNPAKRVA